MSLVNVHNEWDQLEEVIIGTAAGAAIPTDDVSLRSIEFSDLRPDEAIPTGSYRSDIIQQTNEELDALCRQLTNLGVVVRRPAERDHQILAGPADWKTSAFPDYCPRDGFLAIGDAIVEAPMALRSRFFEYLAYKEIFLDYFRSGARWFSAPKPRLGDDMFDLESEIGGRVKDIEPAFDAANILRLGRDLLYLVSDSGNELGLQWVRSMFPEYRVHAVRNVYASTHIDTTFVPLRPGLVFVNGSRVTPANLPEVFRGWEVVYINSPIDTGFEGDRQNGSIWVAMNMLSISPSLVAVDRRQTGIIELLGKHGIDALPVQLTHSRVLGGGFHCVSLDVRRAGGLSEYR